MRMVDSCFRFVNNAPAGVQNAFSDPHVFEYFELVGEASGLPDLSPDGRVGVREMVILMAESHSIHWHLDDSGPAIRSCESRASRQAGFAIRQLPPGTRPN